MTETGGDENKHINSGFQIIREAIGGHLGYQRPFFEQRFERFYIFFSETGVSEEHRKVILDEHNNIRRKLVEGEIENQQRAVRLNDLVSTKYKSK